MRTKMSDVVETGWHPGMLDDAISGKRFKLQCSRFHLTYGAQPPDRDLTLLMDLLRERLQVQALDLVDFSCCCEEGVYRAIGRPHPHTHVLLEVRRQDGARMCVTESSAFDVTPFGDAAHPHIKKVATERHWENCLQYHLKEGIAHLASTKPRKAAGSVVTVDELRTRTLQECAVTIVERGALKQMGALALAHKIVNVRPPPPPQLPAMLYPWQQYLRDVIVAGLPDGRCLIWIYDPIGGMGKSTATEIVKSLGGLVLTHADPKSASRLLLNRQNNGEADPPCVLIDLARAESIHPSLFGTVECLKSRKFTSTKFDCFNVELSRVPVVVVTANAIPSASMLRASNGGLTVGRWVIHIPRWDGRSFGQTIAGIPHGRTYIDRTSRLMERASMVPQQVLGELALIDDRLPWQDLEKALGRGFGKAEMLRAWGAGVVPVLVVEQRVNCGPTPSVLGALCVRVEERPMTEAELAEFKEWLERGRVSAEEAAQIAEEDEAFDRRLDELYGPTSGTASEAAQTEPAHVSEVACSAVSSEAAMSEARDPPDDTAAGPEPRAGSEAAVRSGWAIYIRVSPQAFLDRGSPELVVHRAATAPPSDEIRTWDIKTELALQQEACIAYAREMGLTPVAGPQQVFVDTCAGNVAPDARPGLTALTASGAAGVLCEDGTRLAPAELAGPLAAWLAARGLEQRTVAQDGGNAG